MVRSWEVRLKTRPLGAPGHEHFEMVEVAVPAPIDGEVLVRNRWMSVDHSMRVRMVDKPSYVPPFKLGEAMESRAIGVVEESKHADFAVGDLVQSQYGWREAFVAPGGQLEKADAMGLPPQALLGIAGISGLSAYIGMVRVAQVKAGDVVFVSAAAGAVGSAACLIAQQRGATVIGSAGGAEKTAFLRDELGLDGVIDYKAVPRLVKALAAEAPNGIDVYFDNVGGEHLEAAIAVANPFSRFAICGMIASYNVTEPISAPRNLWMMPAKRLKMEAYIAFDHFDLLPQMCTEMVEWHNAGKLKWKETVYEGIENSVDAMLGLFSGANMGKMLVKLS